MALLKNKNLTFPQHVHQDLVIFHIKGDIWVYLWIHASVEYINHLAPGPGAVYHSPYWRRGLKRIAKKPFRIRSKSLQNCNAFPKQNILTCSTNISTRAWAPKATLATSPTDVGRKTSRFVTGASGGFPVPTENTRPIFLHVSCAGALGWAFL